MKKFKTILAVMALIVCGFSAGLPFGWTANETEATDPMVVKNYKGLQFKVPEDWPIEKVGNTIGPIPMEEYMSRKFADVNQRLKKQEEVLAKMEKRLETVERRKRLNG